MNAPRTFKTAWFKKAAAKVRISDSDLCEAISQVMKGQADDLGGGVFKKRLHRNLYRSIVLTRTDTFWVFEFLFSKQDMPNISSRDLVQFKALAKDYQRVGLQDLDRLVQEGIWMEICNGH